MYKGFYGWSLENANKGIVETKYHIEYIVDEKIWEKFCKTEDIALYTVKELDSMEKALEFFFSWFVDERCKDIKMWQEVYVNGEMILEQPMIPNDGLGFLMREHLNKEMNDRMHHAEVKFEALEKANKLCEEFINGIGADNMYKQFLKEAGNK